MSPLFMARAKVSSVEVFSIQRSTAALVVIHLHPTLRPCATHREPPEPRGQDTEFRVSADHERSSSLAAALLDRHSRTAPRRRNTHARMAHAVSGGVDARLDGAS